jgi:hypothetical protein
MTPTLIGAPVTGAAAAADVDALVDWLPEVGLVAADLLLELHAATAKTTASTPAGRKRLCLRFISPNSPRCRKLLAQYVLPAAIPQLIGR